MEAIWKAAQRERGISIMKLSIIVPVDNLENYVSRTLDSLLSIRFSYDYEIIVVNDGSTDGTEAIVAGYQEKTEKIRLFTIENGGVSHARNVGIRHAQGQYITFMDGDDTVEPDFYEKAVSELDAGGYDFVQGNYREVYEDRVVPIEYVKQEKVIRDRKEMLELYVCPERRQIYNSLWNKVYQGELVRQVQFNTERKNANDQEYNFDVLCIANRVKLLTDMSVDYFQRSDSIVHTLNAGKILNKMKVVEHMLEKNPYPELILPLEERRLLELQEYYFFLCQEKNPQAKEVRREILNCPIRQLWPRLAPNVRRRLLLYRFAGNLHGWYLSNKPKGKGNVL